MRILAIDQANSRTGWALGAPEGPVTFGSYCNVKPGEDNDFGRSLHAYDRWMEDMLDLHQPDIVAFETPSQQFYRTARLLVYIAGIIELRAHRAGCETIEFNTSTMKAAFYGKGHGNKKPPENVALRLAAQWGMNPTNSDEADAAGVFWMTVRQNFEAEFAVWLQRKADAP